MNFEELFILKGWITIVLKIDSKPPVIYGNKFVTVRVNEVFTVALVSVIKTRIEWEPASDFDVGWTVNDSLSVAITTNEGWVPVA